MNPVLNRPTKIGYNLGGTLAHYLDAVTNQWLLIAPEANPAILDMFADRDRKPSRDQVPWAGEFAGKYLTSAVQILRLTNNPILKEYTQSFVSKLISHQDTDGYLGPWPKRYRLVGKTLNVKRSSIEDRTHPTWDSWGHYHAMLGLILWYEETKDKAVLRSVEKMAGLLIKKFMGKKKVRLVDTGSTEMNMAPVHVLCILYRLTKKKPYLELALQLVDEFSAKNKHGEFLCGDYLNQALSNTPFFKTPKPRWESLHPIMALAELYWITGHEKYSKAFQQIWWSIVELDRHNNGGFSSGEQAQGNPYHQGAIETCCTIAWVALSIEMLKLTGNPIVADEIEFSTLNSILGLHCKSGRWVTYNTPMDGVRRASAHDIVFQAREGSSELNCCSVNGPRGLGMVSDWALMNSQTGLYINWYGQGEIKTRVGNKVIKIIQDTEYPRNGHVNIQIETNQPISFPLYFRIPYWSYKTRISINGKSLTGISPASYFCIDRRWRKNDRVKISLDMNTHLLQGKKECRNKVSYYRGPILLAYDRKFNTLDPADLPTIDVCKTQTRLVKTSDAIVAMDIIFENNKIRLCDFASAGDGGSPYISWLKAKNTTTTKFSKTNPLGSVQ